MNTTRLPGDRLFIEYLLSADYPRTNWINGNQLGDVPMTIVRDDTSNVLSFFFMPYTGVVDSRALWQSLPLDDFETNLIPKTNERP